MCREPRQRVDRLALTAQFEIKQRFVLGSSFHDTDRLAGHQTLAHSAVDPGHAGEEGMISLGMLDDQEKAIATKRPGKCHFSVIRRHHLGARSRLDRHPPGRHAGLVHLPEPVAIGTKLELAMAWTGLYHGRQAMRLFLVASVTRRDERGAALRILSHRFRDVTPARVRIPRADKNLAVA